ITFDWDFGVPIITTDTSTQPTPTYTYPDTGTYTGTLIINQGLTCADTGTAIVDLHPAVMANFHVDTVCLGDPTIFTDSSTTTFGTIASWSWDFGDANTSTAQNPTNTYADTGVYTVTLIATNDSTCADTISTVVFVAPNPFANAGPSDSVCLDSTLTLNGIILNAPGGLWSTTGTGTFGSTTSLTTTYTPSVADVALGSVIITLSSTGIGTCNPAVDSLVITFTPGPTVDAGPDQIACANAGDVVLNGSVTLASGGVWTTSGSGTFSPNSTTLNSTYSPSPADTLVGTVALVLTTTGNGGCPAVADAMLVSYTSAPIVDAGPDQTVCTDNPSVVLAGNVTIATGGTWTGGTGTFNPNANTLTATYTPSAFEISTGSVSLVLTSTGNSTCNPEFDTVAIIITPIPIVDAGNDTTVCSNGSDVQLVGNVITATGGIWSTNGTGTFNDSALLNAIYTTSSADSAAGGVTLTLTSTGNGNCNPVSDSINIFFLPGIDVNASADTTICSADSFLVLSGSVNGTTTTGQWTSSGGGIFTPNDTVLSASYYFSALDMQTGQVTLYLTSTGNGACGAVLDSMKLTIIPGVYAGPDTLVCNTDDTIQLNGTIDNISTAQWATNGSGVFVPSDTVLNAQYVMTPADIALGTIVFSLTSSDTASQCPSGKDTIVVSIIPPASASAGADATVCKDTSGYALSGSYVNATGSLWSSSGAGLFLPSPDSLNVFYIPDSAGVDTLVLSVTGSCNNATDSVLLTITPTPIVDAGGDTSVCATIFNVPFVASITTATGGIWTTLNGTGTFTPSDTSLNPTYNGTAADTNTGTIIIVLTSTGNGDCGAYTDTINLTYTPSLIAADAGNDTAICNNTSGITLNGTVFIATGGTWTSSGSGTFSPSPDSLITTYIPSGADTAAGSLLLTLTTTGNGGCAGVSDGLLVSFFAAPSVIAGNDITVCYTTDTVYLSGVFLNAGGAVWSTNGTGIFTPNDSTLSAGYLPSAADVINESVTIYLTTYQSCYDIVDSFKIDIVPAVIVFPSDTIVCNDADTIPVSGIVTGAAGGIWATSGTGFFFPDDTSMSTNYVLSSGDSAAGVVIITLTSTGVLLGCPPVTDVVNITISPAPSLSVGPDQIVCTNQDSLVLSGSTSNAGGVWSSSGTGIFSPDSVTLNATYILSAGDTANGMVVLTLTTTSSCMILSDSTVVTISPPPAANFTSVDVCQDDTTYFTDITPGTMVSWNWDFDDGLTSTVANPLNIYADPGTYNVTLVVVAQGGCTDSITKTITVYPRPQLGFDWEDVCSDDTMFFTNTSTVVSPDVITGYTWDFGDATTSTLIDPNHLYQNNGIYIVTLTAVSNAGCTSSWDTIVVVSPNPVAQFDA
ncbi:MAG: PKD domain-containing protein, partial [Flavobacteriales bacterium]|nr:PKD domain-containing protein [Flavobacteriales bacterium]